MTRRPIVPQGFRGRRLVAAVAAVLMILGAGALLAPILTYPFGRDQGVFAAVADVIERGGAPYRDAWEIKPPGVYYLFRLSFALFGRSMLAPRLLDLLWTLAAGAVLVCIGRRLNSTWAGAAGALCFITYYTLGFDYWHTTQCDGFTSLPLALAAASLFLAEDRRSPWFALVCGALIGIAVAFKFTLGGFLLVACLAALSSPQETVGARAGRTAAYVLGCAAVIAAVAALMHAAGALGDMIEIVFKWNAEYARLSSRVPAAIKVPYQTFRFFLGREYWILRLIGLLSLIGIVHLARRVELGRLRWVVPMWALVMLLGVWVQDKYHGYHWLPVLPPVGLLAGQGMAAGWQWLRRAARRRTARVLGAVGLAAIAVLLGATYRLHFGRPIGYALGRIPRDQFLRDFGSYGRGDFSLAADLRVASFLREETSPEDPLYIWGFEPLVYFLADRRPASRFITVQPLVTPWSPSEWRQEVIEDLERSRPPYILVLHNDVFPWVTASLADSAQQLTSFPELRALLGTHYREVRRMEDFDVWQREERPEAVSRPGTRERGGGAPTGPIGL